MVTAIFINAPLLLVCYQNFYKAERADSGRLRSLFYLTHPHSLHYEQGRVLRGTWYKLF